MAYNFLTLTNDVCKRLNEVELTSSNFASAVGQYGTIKDSVNYAIRDINIDQYEWPFNYSTHTETLVAGTARYAFPADYKTSSNDTFRIKRDASLGNATVNLKEKLYEEYLTVFLDQEYNTSDTSIRKLPEFVFKTPNLGYVLAPVPDQAYDLIYEYYTIPEDLEAYDDVPTIPFQFRKIIGDGAVYYNYLFRGDIENAQLIKQHFDKGVDRMRSLYINRTLYLKSTMRTQGSGRTINERVS